MIFQLIDQSLAFQQSHAIGLQDGIVIPSGFYILFIHIACDPNFDWIFNWIFPPLLEYRELTEHSLVLRPFPDGSSQADKVRSFLSTASFSGAEAKLQTVKQRAFSAAPTFAKKHDLPMQQAGKS